MNKVGKILFEEVDVLNSLASFGAGTSGVEIDNVANEVSAAIFAFSPGE